MPKRKPIMSVNLPSDVILQILSRLPSKSIARFRCVSKLWASLLTLDSPYFTELFLTQSITRPRLLFAIESKGNWYIYSSPQISYKNSESSLSVKAEFHMPLPKNWSVHRFSLVSGLIYLTTVGNQNQNTPMLCNPSTRHLFSLPNLPREERSFLGYNPINKQFSVLAISSPSPSNQPLPSSYQILNLEFGKLFWRSLDCPFHHIPKGSSICINGILYYIAILGIHDPWKIACFDLNSEKFNFVDQFCRYGPNLWVNFKGKLCGITAQLGSSLNFEVSLWVLENVEKQKWCKYVYCLPPILWSKHCEKYCVVGMTGDGDVVLTLYYLNNPFYVYFVNLEKNILRRTEIKGFEAFNRSFFHCRLHYVEDLKPLNWN